MNHPKTKTKPHLCHLCLIALALFFSPATSHPTVTMIEQQFNDLDHAIERLTTSPLLNSSQRSTVEELMFQFMRDNRAVSRVIITNPSGITTFDLRAEDKNASAGRNMANQNWFKSLAQSAQNYYTTIELDGRTHLFWGRPLPTIGDFEGAIAVQIDMDILFALMQTATNFQININSRPFFKDFDWSTPTDFLEIPLNIKGIDNISVITSKTPQTTNKPLTQTISYETETKPKEATPPVEIADERSDEIIAVQVPKEISDNQPTTATHEKSEAQSQNNTLPMALFAMLLLSALLIWQRRNISKKGRFYISEPQKPQMPKEYMISKGAGSSIRRSEEPRSEEQEMLEKPNTNGSDGSDQKDSDIHLEIYRKLHGEMTAWITHEFRRIEKRVEAMSEKIEQLEKKESEGNPQVSTQEAGTESPS